MHYEEPGMTDGAKLAVVASVLGMTGLVAWLYREKKPTETTSKFASKTASGPVPITANPAPTVTGGMMGAQNAGADYQHGYNTGRMQGYATDDCAPPAGRSVLWDQGWVKGFHDGVNARKSQQANNPIAHGLGGSGSGGVWSQPAAQTGTQTGARFTPPPMPGTYR